MFKYNVIYNQCVYIMGFDPTCGCLFYLIELNKHIIQNAL